MTLVNSVNPYRLEGQKTAAFEICEDLGGAPDYLAIPVGNAGNISAYWQGFTRVPRGRPGRDRARDARLPGGGRRAARAGPPGRAPGDGRDRDPHRRPGQRRQALRARDESGGRIDAVTDEEILDAYRDLARYEGIFCEPASAASVAGRAQARRGQGAIDPGATIVCVLTGHGLKDPDTAARWPQPVARRRAVGRRGAGRSAGERPGARDPAGPRRAHGRSPAGPHARHRRRAGHDRQPGCRLRRAWRWRSTSPTWSPSRRSSGATPGVGRPRRRGRGRRAAARRSAQPVRARRWSAGCARLGLRPRGVGWRDPDAQRHPALAGLGSSASATVAGLLAADALAGGGVCRPDRMLALARRGRGSPGQRRRGAAGWLRAWSATRGWRAARGALRPAGRAAVRCCSSPTGRSRRATCARRCRRACRSRTPSTTCGAASLAVAAMASGRLDLLRAATDDRLHEPYRAARLPGAAAADRRGARRPGALGACLSGAGLHRSSPSRTSRAPAERVAAALWRRGRRGCGCPVAPGRAARAARAPTVERTIRARRPAASGPPRRVRSRSRRRMAQSRRPEVRRLVARRRRSHQARRPPHRPRARRRLGPGGRGLAPWATPRTTCIELAARITDEPDPREMDLLLATGEHMSGTLVAMALQATGRAGHLADRRPGGHPHRLARTAGRASPTWTRRASATRSRPARSSSWPASRAPPTSPTGRAR